MIQFIVSVYNGERSIRDCLSSINELTCEKDIFVVDDCSTDNTPEVLRRLTSEMSLDCRFSKDTRRSKAKAINHAYRRGKSEVVCVVDADVVFRRDRFDQLCGLLADLDLLALTEDHEQDGLNIVSFEDVIVPRNCFMVRRSAAQDELLDETYSACGGEDLDLVIRFLRRGFRVGAICGGYEHLRPSLRMGVRRRIHFHIANLRTYIKHRDLPFAQKRLAAIASSVPSRLLESLRQEFSKQHGAVSEGPYKSHED
jgi:glycosyltransferase involved in cell wall biosynthesis